MEKREERNLEKEKNNHFDNFFLLPNFFPNIFKSQLILKTSVNRILHRKLWNNNLIWKHDKQKEWENYEKLKSKKPFNLRFRTSFFRLFISFCWLRDSISSSVFLFISLIWFICSFMSSIFRLSFSFSIIILSLSNSRVSSASIWVFLLFVPENEPENEIENKFRIYDL